ncbi:MAG: 6-phosphogluconolactonase [Streptosporangiales bacterium]|nr:6-phosphogluconolactonase [Streptosporangiales bacterium]
MPDTPTVTVHRDADLLAQAVAARLVTRIVDAQSSRGHASVVLTGGGIGTASLAALRTAPARDAIDWRRLSVWWGDERFLPAGHPERNETAAREALLDHVGVDPSQVHPMAPSDGRYGDDPAAAADAYAAELAGVPAFDVLMLGIGPDAHVASLFPGQPALDEQRRPAVAVHDAPKPPPTRISLTFPTIATAAEVWILAAGAEKADAVQQALAGADPHQVPAAGAHGTAATRFLLDQTAAAKLR